MLEHHTRPVANSQTSGGSVPVKTSFVVFGLAALSIGCAGHPIVVGQKHLGFGWYAQRKPLALTSSAATANAPAYVDVGILFLPGRCTIGYSQVNYIEIQPGDNAHVRLKNLEVFTGDIADADARVMSGGTAPAPEKPNPLTKVADR